eukprot:g11980.t1
MGRRGGAKNQEARARLNEMKKRAEKEQSNDINVNDHRHTQEEESGTSSESEQEPIGRQALQTGATPVKPDWGVERIEDLDAAAYLARVQYEREFLCPRTVVSKKLDEKYKYNVDVAGAATPESRPAGTAAWSQDDPLVGSQRASDHTVSTADRSTTVFRLPVVEGAGTTAEFSHSAGGGSDQASALSGHAVNFTTATTTALLTAVDGFSTQLRHGMSSGVASASTAIAMGEETPSAAIGPVFVACRRKRFLADFRQLREEIAAAIRSETTGEGAEMQMNDESEDEEEEELSGAHDVEEEDAELDGERQHEDDEYEQPSLSSDGSFVDAGAEVLTTVGAGAGPSETELDTDPIVITFPRDVKAGSGDEASEDSSDTETDSGSEDEDPSSCEHDEVDERVDAVGQAEVLVDECDLVEEEGNENDAINMPQLQVIESVIAKSGVLLSAGDGFLEIARRFERAVLEAIASKKTKTAQHEDHKEEQLETIFACLCLLQGPLLDDTTSAMQKLRRWIERTTEEEKQSKLELLHWILVDVFGQR